MRIREAPPVRLVPWGLSRRNNTPTSSFVFFLLLRPPANAPSPRRVSAFAKKIFRTKDNKTTRRHLQEQGTKLFLRLVARVAPLDFMPGDDDEFKFNTKKTAHAVASASARKDPNAGCFHAGCSEWEFDFGFRSGRLLETKIKQQLPSGCSSFSRSSNSKNQPGAALERAPKITTPIDRADDTRDTGSTIGSDEETGGAQKHEGSAR